MPRRPRLVVAHLPHHIVQRGHNRDAVFLSEPDRIAYLASLAELRGALGLKIYAYCLMDNHVHLVVDPGTQPANLSSLMKQLAGRHTMRINRREGRSGSCWEGRFKCSPIDTDRYLLSCMRYVELNPVRAGIVARPEAYRWSSYRTKVGLARCEWLDVDPCYLSLGNTAAMRQSRYRELVAPGSEGPDLQHLRSAVKSNRRTGERLNPRRPGRRKSANSGTDPIAQESGSDPNFRDPDFRES